MVDRIFREGPEGFAVGLSAKNYMSISGAPSATATRDLTKMVEIGAFNKTGAKKYQILCKYQLARTVTQTTFSYATD